MGLLFFTVYLLIVGRWASRALIKFFDFPDNILTKILGVFAGFVTLGWLAGAALLFFPLTGWVLAAVFAINAVDYLFLVRWADKVTQPLCHPEQSEGSLSYCHSHENGNPDNRQLDSRWSLPRTAIRGGNDREVDSDEPATEETPGVNYVSLVFLILVFYGFYLLQTSQTGDILLTPWQTIKPEYIFIFFLSTLTLGLLIFLPRAPLDGLRDPALRDKLKTKTIIFFLILQTLLLHSYLPLTHNLLYGADQWRHIGNEQRFLEGKGFLQPKLSNTEISSTASYLGQLSYTNFWATNVILSRFLSVSLLEINKWFLPILWSIIFPLLLFEMGMTLGWSKKNSLLFSWLGLFPFAWQAGGAFTLPVNFGLLAWLFFVLLILKRGKSPRKEQMIFLAAGGLGLAFGYILYFILFWLAWGTMEVLRSKVKGERLKELFSVLFVAAAIPTIELLFGYSQFDAKINWLAQIKQLLGNFSGYYLASGPRLHDITTGNIIFNQTPLNAFVPNLLTQWRWGVFVFLICFFAIFIYGLTQAYRARTTASRWLVVMAKGIIGGYIISNYFLSGQHLLARRLDGVAALFLMAVFFYGLNKIFINFKWPARSIVIFILSLAITASYSLGPDTYVLSNNQYDAANYVWSQEKLTPKPCVLADTYSLLALEAISKKEIIGGGFPIDQNFAQPERVELLKQMNIAINNDLLKKTAALTGADHCWFIGDTNNFAGQGIVYKLFGDMAVVRYNTNR